MHKFLGILFFYSVTFNGLSKIYDKPFGSINKYINEKSNRYIGLPISESQWELLKIYLKDTPRPISDRPLNSKDIYLLVETFNKIFHIKNIEYKLRMYGVDREQEIKTINQCFDVLQDYIEIIGSSNGISIVIGDWLAKSIYDRKLIEREFTLSELIS